MTDEVGIGEQNNSMAAGSLYVCTDFGAISGLLPGDMAVSAPVGCRTMRRWREDGSGLRDGLHHREMVWYGVLGVGGRWRLPFGGCGDSNVNDFCNFYKYRGYDIFS